MNDNETATMNDNQTISALQAQVAHLQHANESLAAAKDKAVAHHMFDINVIGESLIKAAKTHSMCDEFDEFVEEVNKKLIKPLPMRKRKFTISVTVSAKISTTTEVEMTGTDLDSCMDEFNQNASSYIDVEEVLRDDMWNVDFDDLEAEAEG